MSQSRLNNGHGAHALDKALIDAHARDDIAALARLYADAGCGQESAGNIDAACFYLTQAYVFALAAGLPSAAGLNARLVQYGREEIQPDL